MLLSEDELAIFVPSRLNFVSQVIELKVLLSRCI